MPIVDPQASDLGAAPRLGTYMGYLEAENKLVDYNRDDLSFLSFTPSWTSKYSTMPFKLASLHHRS